MSNSNLCRENNGCHDTASVKGKVDTKCYCKIVTHEHAVLIQEYGSKYIVNYSVQHWYSIVDFLLINNTDTYELVSFRCGGTAVNSDASGGELRLLEEYLGWGGPLQWMVCQLHANEPPLCHLFQYFYEQTQDLTVFQVLQEST
jgi:hypothetical protein